MALDGLQKYSKNNSTSVTKNIKHKKTKQYGQT